MRITYYLYVKVS